MTPPCAVLDTNVWLDLLLFEDEAGRALLAAFESGRLRLVADEATRAEFERVLAYPQLLLDAQRRQSLLLRHMAMGALVPMTEPATVLPRCTDADDQKFLELAHRAQAQWLLTRDNALLALARRTQRAGLFLIQTPMQWLALSAHTPNA